MLKFRSSFKWLIGFFAFLNINCNNALYNPVNENIDPVTSNGEINASFNANISDYYMPQAAVSYSPVNGFNITYNTFQGFTQKSHSFSIGHYINKFDKTTSEKSSSLLLNLGYGLGENIYEGEKNNNYDFQPGKYIGNYSKLFFQMGYQSKINFFDFNISARAVYLDWYKLTYYYSEDPYISPGYNPLTSIALNDPFYFQELSFRIAANRKDFNVFVHMNQRLPIFNNNVDFNTFNIGVGLSLKLNALFETDNLK